MRKLLFPPIVPNSLPAFDKTANLRYYFKPSSANSMNQIQHVQMTIVKLDTNRTILDRNTYPYDVIFFSKSQIQYDESKNFYYVEVPNSIFPTSDLAYKVQIRLGEQDVAGKNVAELGAILKQLDSLSEWSIVSIVMPITAPDFGIQSFDTSQVNKVFSTGQVFSGYYTIMDALKKEILTSYKYNLYSFTSFDDKSTWKLLSSSGDKFIKTGDSVNMNFSFPVELIEKKEFIVVLSIKTKNLYTASKVYKIRSEAYPVLELFNSLDVEPNAEKAEMDITVRSKQILMKRYRGTTIKYIKDEPGNSQYPNLAATHAKINGTVYNNSDITASTIEGKWVCQGKLMFTQIKNSLKEIILSPTIELIQKPSFETESGYFIRVKIGCMKINLAYPTSGNLNPREQWEYRFIARKEAVIRVNNREIKIGDQTKIIKSSEPINPKQEYYFLVEEDNGSMNFNIQKTYLSSNQEI